LQKRKKEKSLDLDYRIHRKDTIQLNLNLPSLITKGRRRGKFRFRLQNTEKRHNSSQSQQYPSLITKERRRRRKFCHQIIEYIEKT